MSKTKHKILTIVGTRPELIKMSPLIPLLDQEFTHILVHSGQHFSENMERNFFKELSIREPDYLLNCGDLGSVEQVANIMIKLENVIVNQNIKAILVHGDTNTTLAGALVAMKHKRNGLKLIHIEAGCRSNNELQAEELNRILVDRLSDLMFAPSEEDFLNLKNEGYNLNKFFKTGNTVIDSCLRISANTNINLILDKYDLQENKYALLTMHRQETVETVEILSEIIDSIEEIAKQFKVIFPIHPRTKNAMMRNSLEFKDKNIFVIEPIGYAEMIGLIKKAAFCITDSGGLQEESSVLNTPAIVIRNETEYQRYVDAGILFLAGTSKEKILNIVNEKFVGAEKIQYFKNLKINFEKGSSSKIVSHIKDFLSQ